MSTRITLDRSIFHGANFDRLMKSPLVKYCKSGRYSIYHSTILIEETLDLLYDSEKRKDLAQQIKFLVDIGNGRWFRDPMDIWNGELEGRSKDAYLFFSRREQKILIQQLLHEATLSATGLEVLGAKLKIRERKDNMKRVLVEMRKTGAGRLRTHLGAKVSSIDFETYCSGCIDWLGEEVIREHVTTSKNVEYVIDKWKANKSRYPYFTLFMKAWAYAMYYAEVEQHAPIDWNTPPDIYFLGTAKELDILVSNDLKFMKSAFDALYGKIKEYISLDVFLDRMSRDG